MVLAWQCISVIGAFTARYLRYAWGMKKFREKLIWFQVCDVLLSQLWKIFSLDFMAVGKSASLVIIKITRSFIILYKKTIQRIFSLAAFLLSNSLQWYITDSHILVAPPTLYDSCSSSWNYWFDTGFYKSKRFQWRGNNFHYGSHVDFCPCSE